jgi:hypothetical protein
MLVVLLGQCPAVLRVERLDPCETRRCRQHIADIRDGITRMLSPAYKV